MSKIIFEKVVSEKVYQLNLELINMGFTWSEILTFWDEFITEAKLKNEEANT